MRDDLRWYQHAVIYELYVDRFAGDFRGLVAKLDYLEQLGVTCIWLLPHYPSPMADDGYDVSDYLDVRPGLGTLEDFDTFIAATHERGIRVLIDLVPNHTSTEHPWFKKAVADPTSPERGYYLFSDTGTEFKDAANPFVHLKPNNWIPVPGGMGFYFTTFMAEQADLNWDNPAVFDEFTRIMDFWLDRGVDGFRVDALTHLIKREGTRCIHLDETHDVIKRVRRYLDERHPGAVLLGEANGTLEDIRSYFGHGDECHMLFHFPLMVMLFAALTCSRPELARTYAQEAAHIPPNCQWATLLRNHDELTLKYTSRTVREEIFRTIDPTFTYALKRDMGTAVRLATAFGNDQHRIAEAFELLLELPGSPTIYMGDEIGMGNVPAESRDVRRTARTLMDWDMVQRQAAHPDSLLNRISELVRVRRAHAQPLV